MSLLRMPWRRPAPAPAPSREEDVSDEALADDVLVNLGSLDDLDAAVGRLEARYRNG